MRFCARHVRCAGRCSYSRACAGAALSAGSLLALLALDHALHLPQALRLPLAVVLGGWIVLEFYRRVLTLALRRFTPSYAARWLEMQRGIGGNVLINAHQFQQYSSRPECGRLHRTGAGYLALNPRRVAAARALADAVLQEMERRPRSRLR